jgi:hypothetical protein
MIEVNLGAENILATIKKLQLWYLLHNNKKIRLLRLIFIYNLFKYYL